MQSVGKKTEICSLSWSLCFVTRFRYWQKRFTEWKVLQSIKLLWTINDNEDFYFWQAKLLWSFFEFWKRLLQVSCLFKIYMKDLWAVFRTSSEFELWTGFCSEEAYCSPRKYMFQVSNKNTRTVTVDILFCSSCWCLTEICQVATYYPLLKGSCPNDAGNIKWIEANYLTFIPPEVIRKP